MWTKDSKFPPQVLTESLGRYEGAKPNLDPDQLSKLQEPLVHPLGRRSPKRQKAIVYSYNYIYIYSICNMRIFLVYQCLSLFGSKSLPKACLSGTWHEASSLALVRTGTSSWTFWRIRVSKSHDA